MGDTDEKTKAAIPSWQQAQPPAKPEEPSPAAPEKATLEQARQFLQDEEVRKSSRERKTQFLKTKGISQGDIDQLLSEEEFQKAETQTQQVEETAQAPQTTNTPVSPPAQTTEDRTPVITYPEFLVKPQRPPPLVTVNGFLTTLKTFSAVSAAIYGTSKYVVEPMVDRLTEARIELHDTANMNLAKLVEKLEATVSEIPEPRKADTLTHASAKDDDDSSYDDPTELFHRDIGVQTSRPASPEGYGIFGGPTLNHPPRPQAAERLADLVRSVRLVKDGYTKETEDYDKTRAVLDDFSREMTRLAYPQSDYVFGYNAYGGASNSNEPDDEIKKAKENIRRVKGVLLSTRSFPAGTAR